MKHKLTRLTSLLLALIMSFSMLLVPANAAFSDVPANAWYEEAVDYVQENGWMKGVSANSFAPNAEVTRAMFVTVLARYAKADVNDEQTTKFDDVPSGTWYTGAVAWAVEKEIVKGVSENAFAPNRAISRQELCTMLARFTQKEGITLTEKEAAAFADETSIAGYAKDAVAYCARTGLVAGYTDHTFRPTATASRAQTAMILMRLDKLIKGEGEDPVPMPAQNFDADVADGMTVNVNAPEGALPEGSTMTATLFEDEDKFLAIRDEVGGNVLAATDITFYSNNVKIEPEKPVEVRIALDSLAEDSNPTVVHLRDDGTIEYVLNAELVSETPVRGLMHASSDRYVRFYAKDFSVYAIIDSDEPTDETRATVNFYNADNQISVTYYVKNSDTAEEMKHFVTDPGAGTLGSHKVFKGWYVDVVDEVNDGANYDDNTTPKTIDDVRTYLAGLSITKDMVVNVYPMIFNSWTLTYLDEYGAAFLTVPLSTKNDSMTYTVSQSYAPRKQDENFDGWIKLVYNAAGELVQEGPTPYVPATGGNITITGDTYLKAYVPEGHWLVFNENGKGATYVAAAFFKSAEPTKAPTVTMVRNGYTFGGWYTDKACTDGKEFTFGNLLTEKTTIYAKWTPVSTANYTILIWKQKVSGTGYDFEDSIRLSGSVGTNINTVTQQGTGNNAYARVNGENKQYTGFHLDHFDQNVQIAPEGSAVLNVYYNRNQYTLTFRRYQNSGTVYKTITALYQQPIGSNFPISVNGDTTYRWQPHNSSTFNQVLVYIDVMPAENITFSRSDTDASTKYMEFYVEALPGQTADSTWNGKSFVKYGNTIPARYNWFTKAEDFLTFNGYDKFGSDPAFGSNGRAYVDDGGTIRLYYTRKVYPINFMDGKYFDGNNNDLSIASSGQLSVVADIAYEADISSYNNYKPATIPDGFVFEGWCVDDACTQKYNFTTMSEGGITVYAKWRQIEYRVFLHPNAERDESLEWGNDNQQMNFRIPFNGFLAEVIGRRTEYNFIGWYLDDETFINAFVPTVQALNNSLTYASYDKNTDFTDVMDKWGDVSEPTSNSDLTGWDDDNDTYLSDGTLNPNPTPGKERFWITQKLDLYAKWSAKLIGATGINVEYDAVEGEGTNAPVDPMQYGDKSDAVAGAASTPNDSNKVFKHWVVQKWNGTAFVNTDVTVLPGGSFKVLKVNAQSVEQNGSTSDNPKFKYTVKLVAVYEDKPEPKPTYIDWYKNDGNSPTPLHTDEDVQINSEVAIYTTETGEEIPSNPGYIFLGWAKKPQFSDGDTTQPKTTYYAGLTEADLFLKYDMENDKYQAKNASGNWVDVTHIAADEKLPYDALYAVWQNAYYIYHSGDNELYAYKVTGASVDLSAEYDTDYLYGGVYTAFGPAKADVDGSSLKNAKAAAGTNGKATDVFDTVYDGSATYVNGSLRPSYDENGVLTSPRYWTRNEALAQTTVTPTGGEVYYIKEVDKHYLGFKTLYVNDNKQNGVLSDLYLLTATDDNLYTEVGFTILKLATNASEAPSAADIQENGVIQKNTTLSKKFTFNSDGDASVSVVVQDFTGLEAKAGLVGVSHNKEYVSESACYMVMPYWKTIDGVVAYSTVKEMTVDTLEKKVMISDFSKPRLYVDFSKGYYKDHNNGSHYPADWTADNAKFVLLVKENNQQTSLNFTMISNSKVGYIELDSVDLSKATGTIQRYSPNNELWTSTADISLSGYDWLNKNCIVAFYQDYDGCTWGKYTSANAGN